jgi:alkyl hydroperoxide reductase subunit D
MTLEALKTRLPDYAKDLKLNLSSLAMEAVLNDQQRAGTFIACALASRNAAAASIMAMNNIYYRFTHLASSPDYRQMPARLRMNVIGKPGVEKADFELWSLAVSAINGCGMCIDAHDKILREAGMTAEQIQAAVRIAALVHAVAATMDGVTATEVAERRAA